jgi:ammonia channel protein AmtB
MQSLAVACLIPVLWLVVGYSLAYIGQHDHRRPGCVFLRGLALDSVRGGQDHSRNGP